MAKFVINACIQGGIATIDLDSYGAQDTFNPEYFLNPEWFPNIDNRKQFIKQNNLTRLGKMYPYIIKQMLGEN